jgi:hypothetical protein
MSLDSSPPSILSMVTPKEIRGRMNLSHVKIFSSLLQATQPKKYRQKHQVLRSKNCFIKQQRKWHNHQEKRMSPGTVCCSTCELTRIRPRFRFIYQYQHEEEKGHQIFTQVLPFYIIMYAEIYSKRGNLKNYLSHFI